MIKFESYVQLFCWLGFLGHFAEISYEFFTKESTTTNIYNEKLTLTNFPIIIKICIDPAFDDKNYGYDNPQKFIVNGRYEICTVHIFISYIFIKVSMNQV